MLFEKYKALLAKIETTEGQDAGPTTDDAIQIKSLKYTGDVEILKRESICSLSPVLHHVGRYYGGFDCEIDLHGSGQAGSNQAPDYASLLKACGAQETIDLDSAYALYEFKSNIKPTDIPSLTVYCFEGAVRKYVLLGCRGVLKSISGKAGELGVLSFSFRGRQGDIGEDTTTFDSIPCTFADAPVLLGVTISLDGLGAVPIKEFEVAFDGDPVLRQDITKDCGYAGAILTSMDMTGHIIFESQPFSSFNEWQDLLNESEKSLSIVIDKGTGKKITISLPKIKAVKPEVGGSDGILETTYNFGAYPDANNTVLSVKFE